MEADSFGSDFGQRVDLCVRIREILRNYPVGTSVFKELIQKCVLQCKQPLHARARAQASAMSRPLRAGAPTYSLRAIF